ncbi:DUF4328 domain-containing protein [Corallococcus silvisoli]|uniref:DUF4328 domain-containing protein n=1 Tax=Corallococcus silvisoli TaxID=2697031 RepID=UPI001377F23D|nr:DUF4328 domain-containing protein [Corallococcus silvisoli]NBD11901.1 DUF4328 domain-containing protein [Corallococcus silvisoli]
MRLWVFNPLLTMGYTQTDAIGIYGFLLFVMSAAKTVAVVRSVVGFLMWQYRAVRIAKQLEVSRTSPRRAILSWFIPGVNLFKPSRECFCSPPRCALASCGASSGGSSR